MTLPTTDYNKVLFEINESVKDGINVLGRIHHIIQANDSTFYQSAWEDTTTTLTLKAGALMVYIDAISSIEGIGGLEYGYYTVDTSLNMKKVVVGGWETLAAEALLADPENMDKFLAPILSKVITHIRSYEDAHVTIIEGCVRVLKKGENV